MPDNAPSRDRDRRARQGLFGIASLGVLAALAGALLLVARPVDLPLPGWTVALIEARLDRALGNRVGVTLGRAALRLPGPGRRAGLALGGVGLTSADGSVEVALPRLALVSDGAGGVAAIVDGARLILRRDSGGRVALSLQGVGGGGDLELDAESLAAAADKLARAMALPGIARLSGIEMRAASLLYDDARLAHLWELGGGRVGIRRAGGNIAIVLGAELMQPGHAPGRLDLKLDHRLGAPDVAVRLAFGDLAAAYLTRAVQGVALSGTVAGEVAATIGPAGPDGPVRGRIALTAGTIDPGGAGAAPLAVDRLELAGAFDPADGGLEIAALDLAADGVEARLTGRLWPDGGGAALGQLRIDAATIDRPERFAAPLRIRRGGADLRFDPDARRVEIGQIWLDDGAALYRGSVDARLAEDGAFVAAAFTVPELPHGRLMALWPLTVVPGTRAWMAEFMHAGTLRHVAGALRLAPGLAPRLAITFDVDGLSLSPVAALPPIRAGAGHGQLTERDLSLFLAEGHLEMPDAGPIDLAGTEFAIPDITVANAPAAVVLRGRSTLPAALALLDHAPFHFLEKAGLPAVVGEGAVRAEARIALPLTHDIGFDAVDIAARADLVDVTSTALVPGRSVAADRLAVAVDDTAVRLDGDLTLDGLPVSVAWRQPLAKGSAGSRLDGQIELSPRFFEVFGIDLPAGSVTGRGRATLGLDLPRGGDPAFALVSDLAGVGLSLPGLGWSLSPAATGTLGLAGRLGPSATIDRLQLDAPGLLAEGRIDLRPGGALDAARFDRLRIGGWLDAAVVAMGDGRLALRGGTLDLARAPRDPGGGGAGGPIDLQLDRVLLADGIALTDLQGRLDRAGGLSGRLTGRVNGGARVAVTLTPGRAGTDIQVLANAISISTCPSG
jgi:hypothetical protein